MKTINKFKLSILLVAAIIPSLMDAQFNKFYVSGGIGISVPLASVVNEMPLKEGLYLDLDGSYFVTKSVGISVLWSHQDYSITNTTISDYSTSGYSYITNVTYQSNYRRMNLLAGPCFAIGFGKISVDIKPVAGVVFNYVPGYNVHIESYNNYFVRTNTYDIYGNENHSSKLSYGGSVGIRMALTEMFSLKFFTGYIGSKGCDFFNIGVGVVYGFKSKSDSHE